VSDEESKPWHRRVAIAVAVAVGAGVLATISGLAQSATSGLWDFLHHRSPPSGSSAHLPTASVQVDFHEGKEVCGDFVSDRTPSNLPVPKSLSNQSLHQWSVREDAPATGFVSLDVVIQSPDKEAVVLRGAEVHIVHRGPAPVGSSYYTQECGGGLGPRFFQVDLDSRSPSVVPTRGSNGPAQDFPFKVSASDPEDLRITALCQTCGDTKWYLTVDTVLNGKEGKLRIDDGGHPFRIVDASHAAQPLYVLNARGTEWVR
jgi:hypothetical protein